jgi:outer membrane protein TolC
MKQYKSLLIFTSCLSLSTLGFSQDTIIISKNDILQKAAEQNLQLKIATKLFESAKAEYHETNATFLPQIVASHTAISTTNPLMAFGSKLNQERLTAADFNPNLLNNPDRINNYATKLELLQPIINVDGYLGRQAAKAKMQASNLQIERSKEYVLLEVNKAYMQLQLAYKGLKVLMQANTTAQANLKLTTNYFEQGTLQKTDLLAIQVHVYEVSNQLQYAMSNVQNASDYIAFLLNESESKKVYEPSDEMEEGIDTPQSIISFSENRKDILAIDQSKHAYFKIMQASKMNFLPRLNAFGSYEMYDTKLFGTNAQGYLLGVQLSWSLFDGYKSIGKLEKAKADYQKTAIENEQYKAQSLMEWEKTARQLKDAENKVKLSQLSFQQSQEAFRIRQNRFEQGLEKTNDLLTTETQMLQKELEHLQSIFEYNTTKQYLQFLTK